MSIRTAASATLRWGALSATLGAAVLWLASGWLLIGLRYGGTVYQAGIQVRVGVAAFYVWSTVPPGPATGHPTSIYVQSVKMTGDTPGTWKWAPLRYHRRLDTVDGRTVTVALWVIAVVGAGAAWLLRRWHHRPRPGRCRTCGYDLTGAVGVCCPECGTPSPAAAGAPGAGAETAAAAAGT